VEGTTADPDGDVEDRAHYCYVAVAIDTRNGKISGFSNPAPAVIPPATDLPSCGQNVAKKANTKKNRSHR